VETGKTSALRLELFGKVIEVAPADQVTYLRFLLRPHAVEYDVPPPRLHVEFVTALVGKPGDDPAGQTGTPAPRSQLPLGATADSPPMDILVRDDKLTLLSRRPFRGWGNVPPQVPPFAAWPDRLAVVKAVVLASDNKTVVALIGSPDSAIAGVAVALARRGWTFVSGSLLVLDRAHGSVLTYQAPLEARGAAAAALREAGLPRWMCRGAVSPVSGEVLQVRPEALGPIMPITSRLSRPALVRLCQGPDDRVRLEPWVFRPSVWPADAGADFAAVPKYRLSVPEAGGTEDAARLIGQLPPEPGQIQEDECRAAPSIATDLRAGSTESPPT